MGLLETTIGKIVRADMGVAERAAARQDMLTKPRGSLGRLEELSVRIAGMTGTPRPKIGTGAVFVMAGDHGVAAEGVSAFPQEVTPQMVLNFLAGGAGINVLAKWADCRVVVTDCGVKGKLPSAPGLYEKRIRPGTDNIAVGPAMSRAEAVRAVETGIEVFEAEYERERFGAAATGDMGIANTTPSSAIVAAFTGVSPEHVTGRGTGIDDEGWRRKVGAITRALSVNKPDASDGLDVLSKVGGFEIGAIAGVVLAASARKVPVIVDGFISTAGALIARSLAPACVDYMVAAHKSVEIGHRAALDSLGLVPLLDLNMRLGEGTGAAIALALCDAACRALDEMATFGEAGVSEG